MIKIIDKYIVVKYLQTFFFTVLIFSMIGVVIDFSDKVEEFIDKSIPLKLVVFDYYLNWMLWLNGLLFPLYAMIAVIFFTSRLAFNSEIISILNAGVSFKRLLVSYFMGAGIIFILHFVGNHYVIPLGNKVHFDFQNKYIWEKISDKGKKSNVHIFIGPEAKIYVNYFSRDSVITDLRLEKIRDNKVVSLLRAKRAEWKGPPNKWLLKNYERRKFRGMKETIETGEELDTIINMSPADFVEYTNQKEMMTTPELQAYIAKERERAARNLKTYEVELFRRSADPFTILILTVIGVSVASRKVRGGVGLHLALGISIGAIFIFLSRFSETFAINQSLPAILGVWLPNIVFGVIAFILFLLAQK